MGHDTSCTDNFFFGLYGGTDSNTIPKSNATAMFARAPLAHGLYSLPSLVRINFGTWRWARGKREFSRNSAYRALAEGINWTV